MIQWILGGAAIFFAGNYLSKLRMASENIVAQVAVKIRKVTFSGIELLASVRLQNANPINLRIQHPFVEIRHQGMLIGSSILQNKIIELPGNTERAFDLHIRSAGWLTLVQTLGMVLVQKIKMGKEAILFFLKFSDVSLENFFIEGINSSKSSDVKDNPFRFNFVPLLSLAIANLDFTLNLCIDFNTIVRYVLI